MTTWHQEGGKDFDRALGNNGSGNPKYWIKPDKSFKDYRTGDISNAGIEKHECNVAIKTNVNSDKNISNIIFNKVNKSGATVKVLKDGVYSMSFYSVNGKLKTTISRKLSAGSHQINFEKGTLANGAYLVEIKNGQNITREKVVLE
jgi:hypothetical protein